MADDFDKSFGSFITGAPAAAPAPAQDDFASSFGQFVSDADELGKANARLNLFAANKENPDEAAKAQAMGRFIGLPPDVVERNMGEVEARVKLARQAKVLEQSPALVQWLQDGANARVAHDDFEKLSFIEKTLASITRGGTESVLANERGRLGYEAFGGGLAPDKAQRLATIDARLKAPQGGDDDFFQHIVRTTSGLVAGFADQFTSAPVLAGGAFGAALGTVGGPLAPLTAPAGAAIGAAGGLVADGYRVGAGQIWLSLKDMRDGEGREIDPNVRTAAAIGGGLVLGFLNLVGFKGATAPTVEGIKGLVRQAVGEAVQRPTAAAALAQFGVGMAKAGATGAGFGAANESTMIGAEQIARMLSSGDFATILNDPAQRQQAMERVVSSMTDMALGFGAMHVPARTGGLVHDLATARRSTADQAVLQKLVDGAADSATRERAPDAFARFIDQQADGSPVETLFIPAERVRELYQRFDLDPFELSDDPLLIGGIVPDFKQQMEQGLRTGGDVAVPLGQYIAKIAGTKIHDALKEDIRVRSDGLTQRELKDFADRYKEAVDQAGLDAVERGAKAADLALPGQRVFDDVQRQSQAAGYTLDVSRQHGALFRQRYETRAARMGFGDAYTHFQDSGVRIERALPEELKRYTPNEVDAMLNEIRAGKKGVPPGRLIGPSLLEYLASKGGLKDDGGELKAMDADRWHRDKPFRRQLVQEKGLGLDEAALAAHEEGYFPELQGKVDRPEISHLLDAIREELAGKPRHGEVDPAAAVARAREQTKADLDQLIQSSGEIDLKKMSNREVRPILDRLMGEADGKTLEQPVYHGSPHRFETFSLDKIGTGEGAQAYGWGLYFAGKKAVAEYYRAALTRAEAAPVVLMDGATEFNMMDLPRGAHLFWQGSRALGATHAELVAVAQGEVDRAEAIKSALNRPRQVAQAKTLVDFLTAHPDFHIVANEKPGRLYHVEIPDDGAYLLWDRPFKDQTESVKDALLKLWVSKGGRADQVAPWTAHEGARGEDIYNSIGVSVGGRGRDKQLQEAASKALLSVGVPGIKYLDGSSRSAGEGAHNYVLFDDSLAKITTYEQPARGSITFGGGEAVIRLFRDRNLSTFVHESGHLFLEELMVDAAHPDAPAQVRADATALLKWFGIDDAAKITTDHHEQLARAFEAYLLEGKAPSVELGGVFRRISAWLVKVYETVANLNTPINDEVRAVFDRLLASDEQLTAAREAIGERRLFGSADEAGMTDAEFAAYNRTIERSRDTAESTLLKKLMGDVRRRFTAQWKAEESTVKEAVAREVDSRREVAALVYLRTGKLPNAAEGVELPHLRLSREALVEMYGGPGILEQMPRGVPPIVVARGGVHPDVVAETMGGFRSGRELVDALLAQQDEQRQLRESGEKRSLRTYLIEEETNRRMVDRHGDMLNDGQIEQEALAALHSDRSLQLHAAELRMIGRRAGRSNEATPAQMAREWAARAIADKTVKEAQQVGSYQRAERAAGHAVEKALLAQDYEEAFRQKQAQVLSHALWMEAKDASDQVDRGVRMFSRYADAETLKSMDQGYLEQIHGLLERFDFRQVTQKELARRASFAEWATRQEANGVDVVAPASLMSDAFRTHYSDMTMGEFRGLVDTVKQVAHLGELKESLIIEGKRRAFREVKDEALAAMSELRQRPVNDDINPLQAPGLRATAGRVGHYVRMLDAAMLKMETVFDWLDNKKEDGVFRRVVWQPIERAQGERNVMLGEYTRKFLDLRNGLDRDTQRRMVEVVDTPELINKETGRPWKMRLEQVASMALNWGNAGNREKLLKGYGWDEAAVKAVLDRHMTPDLWKFTQSAWDLIETLWPKIEELERRVNGVAPDKVERVKVETPHGTFEGGYFPAVYDPNKSFHMAERMAESIDSLFPKDYGRATTAKGYTKERVDDFAAPMHLSLDVLPRHIAEVIHDITHREVLMQADKFLSDKEIQKGVADALGREYVGQFKPWLQHIASEYAQDRRELSAWDSLVKSARMRASMVGLGFRITTILQQPFGLMDTAEVIGARWVGSGLAEAYGNPLKWKAARDFVFEHSPEMANRMNESERDIRDQMRQLVGRSGLVADARRFAYYGIAMMDMGVAIPSWLGGYRKALHEGMSEADAATYANGVVRQSQGAGGAKDLAAVQRGTETMKLATMFYSYFSHYYQRQRDIAHDARNIESAADIPHLLARTFYLMVVPGLASALVSGQGPTDDEDWGAWAVRKTAVGLFMGVPGLRDVASWADHKISGQYARDYQYTPVTRIVDVFGKTVDDLWNATAGEGDVSDKWARHAIETAGYIFGLPTGQAAQTFGFLSDVGEGREQPENVGEWLKGLVYGKTKDK